MKKMKKFQGFTLIEILVVMLIISIVTGAALFTLSHNQNKRLESLANELVNLIRLAEEEALLRPATLGLGFSEKNFRFYLYQEGGNKKKPAWQPLSSIALGSHALPNKTAITVKIQNKVVTNIPQIIISPSGDITPFVILIGNQEAPPLFRVIGFGNGSLKSERFYEENE